MASGKATMVGGVVLAAQAPYADIRVSDLVIVSPQTDAGSNVVVGGSVSAGVGVNIDSSSNADTRVVNWAVLRLTNA